MITLALSQLMLFVFLQAPFTGGEDGLQGVPRGRLFGLVPLDNDMVMYTVVAAFFLAGYALIQRVVHSPFGQVLRASRENQDRALSLGYDIDKFKLLAFTLSAALSGLAGGLKTLVLGFEVLSDAHWHMSGQVVLMTLVGGLGTLFGPVVGAATMVAIESGLADKVGSWVQVIMGATFVVCVLGFRRGIVGELGALWAQAKDLRKTRK
jgi:branched-chain amino acid transport system permease protein